MERRLVTTLLFLPAATGPYRWLTLDPSGMSGEGEGLPATDDRIIAIAPADAVTLHWAELPARSPAQAAAAARLVIAEASATPLAELHVAIGDEGEANRPIAVVDAVRMRDWLVALAGLGIDPDAVIPAPLLLPRPDAGFLRAEIGGESVIRGQAAGFADEARLTDLVTGGVAPTTLDRPTLIASLIAVAATPPLDLRQGAFARRRHVALDWPLIRRLGIMAATILLLTLVIDVVRIAKYSIAASTLEARADALGRTALPPGETVTDIDRQVGERLSSVRGPGLGFTNTAAAVYAVVRATPGVELTGLDFSPNGTLKLSVRAARESLPTDLKRGLEAAGFTVTAGVFQSANGRVTGEMTVARP